MDRSTALPIRWTRWIVALVVAVMLLMALLLTLERGDTNPSLEPTAHKSGHPAKADNSQGSRGKGHAKHCNDGKGRDDEKNKHCRPHSP